MKGFCLYSVVLQEYQPNLDHIIIIDYEGEVNRSNRNKEVSTHLC